MFFLFDENVAKCCAEPTPVYTAQRSIHVEGLGPQAPDLDIFRFVLAAGCILVTKDGDDFESIMREWGEPVPMVVFPGATRAAEQRSLLLRAAAIIEDEVRQAPGRQFTFDGDGTLVSYDF